MTGAQLALASGALITLGLVLAVWRLVPAAPDLGDVVERLSPTYGRRRRGAVDVPVTGGKERVGLWAMRNLPGGVWGRVPNRELALLRISLPRYYGEKITFALLGLVFPSVLVLVVGLFGFQVPVVVPVAASLALAGALWFLPNLNVRDDAKRGRLEFHRALGAYVDLVALERNSGSGPRQAMEVAADIGHSWVFHRVGEELARSAGPAKHPGTRSPSWLTRSASQNWPTWPTSCACPGRRAPRCTPPSGLAPRRCAPHCSPTPRARRTSCPNAWWCPAACSASSSSPCSSPRPCSAC